MHRKYIIAFKCHIQVAVRKAPFPSLIAKRDLDPISSHNSKELTARDCSTTYKTYGIDYKYALW